MKYKKEKWAKVYCWIDLKGQKYYICKTKQILDLIAVDQDIRMYDGQTSKGYLIPLSKVKWNYQGAFINTNQLDKTICEQGQDIAYDIILSIFKKCPEVTVTKIPTNDPKQWLEDADLEITKGKDTFFAQIKTEGKNIYDKGNVYFETEETNIKKKWN